MCKTSGVRRRLTLVLLTVATATICPAIAAGQTPADLPRSATESQGLIPEPGLITRLAIFTDRHLGKVDLTNGFYIDTGNLMLGTGWLAAGPGYRHWYSRDHVFIDASASISTNNSGRAHARFELPRLARSRVGFGLQGRWQDFRNLDYYNVGPASTTDQAGTYRLESKQLAGYLTLRPVRWLAVTGELGWLSATFAATDRTSSPSGHRRFVPASVSLGIDSRDFPSHPTRGILARAVAVHYADRDGGAYSVTQYESDGAVFVPIAGSRVIVALHGWAVASDDSDAVPFYLQPTIGGGNTLRSYANYRFRDRNMLVTNSEVRFALTTHMDLAAFADIGGVAPRFSDIEMNKRSYGMGVRLHTRRMTFASLDVANGREGWRALFSLNDSFDLTRVMRRAIVGPTSWGIRP